MVPWWTASIFYWNCFLKSLDESCDYQIFVATHILSIVQQELQPYYYLVLKLAELHHLQRWGLKDLAWQHIHTSDNFSDFLIDCSTVAFLLYIHPALLKKPLKVIDLAQVSCTGSLERLILLWEHWAHHLNFQGLLVSLKIKINVENLLFFCRVHQIKFQFKHRYYFLQYPIRFRWSWTASYAWSRLEQFLSTWRGFSCIFQWDWFLLRHWWCRRFYVSKHWDRPWLHLSQGTNQGLQWVDEWII